MKIECIFCKNEIWVSDFKSIERLVCPNCGGVFIRVFTRACVPITNDKFEKFLDSIGL